MDHNTSLPQGQAVRTVLSAIPRALADGLGNATNFPTPLQCLPEGQTFERDSGELVTTPTQADLIREARTRRYQLQDAARHILFGYDQDGPSVNSKGYDVHHRTCTCGRNRLTNTAQIHKTTSHGKAFYGGLMQCGIGRTCPVCAAKISEHKGSELREMMQKSKAQGLELSMLTLTAPHDANQPLGELLDGLISALSAFHSGSPYKRFRERFGILGHVRSFEIRYGGNGWHPHFHIIYVSEKALPPTIRDSKGRPLPTSVQDPVVRWMADRWASMCLKSGLSRPNEYGLDLRNGDHAGAYVSKYGSEGEILTTKEGKTLTWDMADEATKGQSKLGRQGSLSPFDLLGVYADSDCEEEKARAAVLFLEFSRKTANIPFIRWTPGLRTYFEMLDSLSDEEIVHQQTEKADLVCHLTPVEWGVITGNNHRSTLLTLAETGGSEAVARFVFSFVGSGDFGLYYAEFVGRRDNANLDSDEDYSRLSMCVDSSGKSSVKAASLQYEIPF